MQQAGRRPTWDYTSTYHLWDTPLHLIGGGDFPVIGVLFIGRTEFGGRNRLVGGNSKTYTNTQRNTKGGLKTRRVWKHGYPVVTQRRSSPVKDVATIKLGAQNYVINGQIDGHPAATCMIFQTAGSNANEVVGEINDYLEIIEKELSKDVKIAHLMSTKDLGMQVSFRLTTYL